MRAVFALLVLSLLLAACSGANVCIDDGVCSTRERTSNLDCSDCQDTSGPFLLTDFGVLEFQSKEAMIDSGVALTGGDLATPKAESLTGVTNPDYAAYATTIISMANAANPKTFVLLIPGNGDTDAVVNDLKVLHADSFTFATEVVSGKITHTAKVHNPSTGALVEAMTLFVAEDMVYVLFSESNDDHDAIVSAYADAYASVVGSVGVCGDNTINTGEQCDFGSNSDGITASQKTDGTYEALVAPGYGLTKEVTYCSSDSCQLNTDTAIGAQCGDGTFDVENEECDFGVSNDGETFSESETVFEAFILPAAGSTKTAYTCDVTCKKSSEEIVAGICGNDILEAAEQCDFGPQNGEIIKSSLVNGSFAAFESPAYGEEFAWTTCTDTCALTNGNTIGPHCGDGVKQASEACDDGDRIDENTCTNECEFNPSVTSLFVPTIDGVNIYTEDVQDDGSVSARNILEFELGGNLFDFASYAATLSNVGLESAAKSHVAVVGFPTVESAIAYVSGNLIATTFDELHLTPRAVFNLETYAGSELAYHRQINGGMGVGLVDVEVSVFISGTKVYIVYTENDAELHEKVVESHVSAFATEAATGSYCVDEDSSFSNDGIYENSYVQLYAYADDQPIVGTRTGDTCSGTNVIEQTCSGTAKSSKTVKCNSGCAGNVCKLASLPLGHAQHLSYKWGQDILIDSLNTDDSADEEKNRVYVKSYDNWASPRSMTLTVNGVDVNVSYAWSTLPDTWAYYDVNGFEFQVYHMTRWSGTNYPTVWLKYGLGNRSYGCTDSDEGNDPSLSGLLTLNGALQDGRQEGDKCVSSTVVSQVSCNLDKQLDKNMPFDREESTCAPGTTCNAGACI